jgi:hypothetical protein
MPVASMTSSVVTGPPPTHHPPRVDPQANCGTHPRRRILILTAAIGAGHISTAWALKRRLEHDDETASVEIDEPIKRVPGFSRLPRLYRFMTAYLPVIWAVFYYSRKIHFVRKLYGYFIRHRMRSAFLPLQLKTGDTVVITYSMYCNCIDRFTRAGVRTVVLVTDLFGGPDEWFTPGADQYFVPTEHMAAMARARNIEPDRIMVRRLPTLVADTPSEPRWSADRTKALRILVIGGSEGLGPLKAVTEGILCSRHHVSVTVVCGNNSRLQKRLQRSRALILGFVPEVAITYRDYDLVVTKPGSVTLMELIQQNVPFVLLPGIAGIEAGNTRLFKAAHVPLVSGRSAARTLPESLVNEDLSLSSRGASWVDTLHAMHDALPIDYLTIEDVSPSDSAASVTV